MREDVVFTLKGRELIAALACEIDHHSARRMREKIDRELFLHRPDTVTMDFSAVSFMDSSGIGLILGRVESAAAVGATVRVKGLSQTLMKIVRLSGLERVKNLTVMKSCEKDGVFK